MRVTKSLWKTYSETCILCTYNIIIIKTTYSDAAYTQHLGFRHVGARWSASCFDSEIYWEPDTGETSSVLVNGVLSVAICGKKYIIITYVDGPYILSHQNY